MTVADHEGERPHRRVRPLDEQGGGKGRERGEMGRGGRKRSRRRRWRRKWGRIRGLDDTQEERECEGREREVRERSEKRSVLTPRYSWQKIAGFTRRILNADCAFVITAKPICTGLAFLVI